MSTSQQQQTEEDEVSLSSSSTHRSNSITNNNDNNDIIHKVERIYIGGLHPPELTVQDLLRRLRESLGSVIDILPPSTTTTTTATNTTKIDTANNDTKTYVHLNLRTKKKDDIKSALEHVQKIFGGVTWRGCKIRVEPAKPNFLERLKQERQQQQQQEEENDHYYHDYCNDATISTNNNRRRFLKIRERYGEQHFKVDTKPYEVSNWYGMNDLLRKLGRRKRYFQQKLLEDHNLNLRREPKLNRAVHLRFVTTTTATTTATTAIQEGINNNKKENTQSSSSSSLSSSGRPLTQQQQQQQQSESAKDFDSDNDDYDNNNNLQGKQKSKKSTSQEESDADSSSSARAEEEDDDEVEDDRKSSSSSSNNKLQQQQIKFRNLSSGLDEFESAIDANSSSSSSSSSSSEEEENVPEASTEQQQEENDGDDILLQDVECNLNILSSMFPEMKKSQPRKIAGDPNCAIKDGVEEPFITSNKTGWSATGVMLRYDPRKEDAMLAVKRKKKEQQQQQQQQNQSQNDVDSKGQQGNDNTSSSSSSSASSASSSSSSREEEKENSAASNKSSTKELSKQNSVTVIETDDKSDSTESGGGSSSDKEDDKNEKQGDSTEIKTEPPGGQEEGNIYKQDRLEDVFREAREAYYSAPKKIVQDSIDEDAKPRGAFAFDFNLGNDSSKIDESNNQTNNVSGVGGFSFSFFPGTGSTEEDDRNNKEMKAEEAVEGEKTKNDQSTTRLKNDAAITTFRRKGMLFPQEVLDRYQEDFYVMNDGLKILQDLERYRHDEDVIGHWTDERERLTKDWKRKRKHALAARNKHKANKNPRYS